MADTTSNSNRFLRLSGESNKKCAQEAIGSEPCTFELLRDNLPELAGHFGPQIANKQKTGQKIKSPTVLTLPEIAKKKSDH